MALRTAGTGVTSSASAAAVTPGPAVSAASHTAGAAAAKEAWNSILRRRSSRRLTEAYARDSPHPNTSSPSSISCCSHPNARHPSLKCHV